MGRVPRGIFTWCATRESNLMWLNLKRLEREGGGGGERERERDGLHISVKT